MSTDRTRRRPRGPAVLYTALATAIAVLLGVIALTATQPPPPTIAEFAPQAQQQIEDAPDEQTNRFGSEAIGVLTPTPTPAPPTPGPDGTTPTPTPNIPRKYECIGSPPRQIDDHQAPPCVPFWEGENGGATAQGVTRDEIKVAWPRSIERDDDIRTLASFFNSRFEFYGRKIRLEQFKPHGGWDGETEPDKMKADANGVYDHHDGQLFASLMYAARDGAEHYYYDEMAKLGVLSVDARQSLRPAAHFEHQAPYQWAVEPPYDVMMRSFGTWICRTLADKPPVYAGDDIPKDAPRAIGVLRAESEDRTTPDDATLLATLQRCGIEPADQQTLNAESDDLQEGTAAITRLKSEGVTSVVCLCHQEQLKDKLMPAATSQSYTPEWLLGAFQFQDRETAAVDWPQNQAEHAFGVAFRNKWLPAQDMPWFWAMKEADPGWQPPPEQGYNQAILERYAELLLLSSGIQLAGPNLTAKTFAEGLRKATFPNPTCGAPPYYQACVGFGPNDYYFHDDATMIWWSPEDRNYTANNPRGAFCYVDKGERYAPTNWPEGDPAYFKPPCR